MEPRLSCAIRWALEYQPEDERTKVRDTFAADAYFRASEEHRRGIALLLEHLDEYWNLQALTQLVYGIPKLLRGLAIDAPANKELKRAQRAFFAVVYSLLCDSETGPRLPTLFLSIGKEHVRRLLTPAVGEESSPMT